MTEGRCDIVAVSVKLRDLMQEAARGLTDQQVMALTGLKRSTWQKLHSGEVVGLTKLLAAADGLQIDRDDVISAAGEVSAEPDPFNAIGWILRRELNMSPGDCLQVQRLIREITQKHDGSEQSAA